MRQVGLSDVLAAVPPEPTFTETKTCTRCGEAKALEDFFHDATRGDGLTGRCKPCHRADAKRYREKESFKKKAADRSARWRERHPDRVAEIAKRDKEKNAARLKTWRGNNKEKVFAQSLRRRPKQLMYFKEQAECVSDYYVKHSLHLPLELAPFKRVQLKIFRATKTLNQTIKEKRNAK